MQVITPYQIQKHQFIIPEESFVSSFLSLTQKKKNCKNHNHSISGIQVQALYLCDAFLLILSDSLFPLYFPWLSLPVKLCPRRFSHNLSLPISARPTGSKHTLPTCLSHCSSLHWPHSVSASQLPAVSEESKRDSRLAVLGCVTQGFLHS